MRKGNLGNPKAKQNSIRPATACPRRSRLSKGRRNCSCSRWPRGGWRRIRHSGLRNPRTRAWCRPGLGHGEWHGNSTVDKRRGREWQGWRAHRGAEGFHGRRGGAAGPGASLALQDRNCSTFDGPRLSANQLWGLRVLAQTDDGIWGAERRRPRDADRGHLRRGARWSFPPSPRVGDRS